MKKRHIVFQLKNDYCAIDISEIKEIVELDTMIRTRSSELNVILWNNRSIPVIDPIAMLTLNEHKPTIKSRIVIVSKEGMDYGILFDAVLGVVEIHMSEVNEPMLNEPRYVKGVIDNQVKIFAPDALLTQKNITSFDAIYQLELYHLEEGIKVRGLKGQGKQDVVENIRLRSLNWLVRATKTNMDEAFISEAVQIHDLISKL